MCSRFLLTLFAALLLRFGLHFCCAFAALVLTLLLRFHCAFAALLLRVCCAFAALSLRFCRAFAARLLTLAALLLTLLLAPQMIEKYVDAVSHARKIIILLTPAYDQAARVATCRLGYSCRHW